MKPFKFSYSPDDSPPIEMFIPDTTDRVADSIRRRSVFYEQDLLLYLRAEIQHGKTIIDVSANIGNHTLFFAKFMDARVLAIEPHPEIFEQLLFTVASNKLDKVTALQSAVGDSVGLTTLKIDRSIATINRASFTLGDVDDPVLPVTVPISTLPSILESLPHIDIDDVVLIKIDVEGWEQAVLRGMLPIIESSRPDFAIEAWTSEDFTAIKKLLLPFGYGISKRFCGTPTYRFSTKL